MRPLYDALTRLQTATFDIATILNEADRVSRVGDGITLALPRETTPLLAKIAVATSAIHDVRVAVMVLGPRFMQRWQVKPGTRFKLSIDAALSRIERLCYACQCAVSFKCKADSEVAQAFHATGKGLRLLLNRLLTPPKGKSKRRVIQPAPTYTLEFERPIPISRAAEIVNEPQSFVTRKLRRCGFPITGTLRNYVAELTHLLACYHERHDELVAWADWEHPSAKEYPRLTDRVQVNAGKSNGCGRCTRPQPRNSLSRR